MRLAVLLCGAALVGTAIAQLPVEIHEDQASLLRSADAALASNKQLVYDFWRVVRQAHEVERAPDYVAEDYVEHEPGAASGRSALIEHLGRLPRATVRPTIDELVAIVAERDLVTLALRRELPDLAEEGQTYTTTGFHLFRVANGKIVEHWSHGSGD